MQELCLEPIGPFGGRKLSLREVERRRFVRTVTQATPACAVNKWRAFRHLCLAKADFELSDRTLVVLEALLTFHPETVLAAGAGNIVVFPSNRRLSFRARGMAASTLRRHLAALVDRGLIFRRDSSNGKRFARRNARGGIEEAFGFDLSLFVARAEEFEQAAEATEARRLRMARMKQSITITRRDIAKMIAAGVEGSVCADWPALHRRLQGIVVPAPRTQALEALELALGELTRLASECLALLEAAIPGAALSPVQDANEIQVSASTSAPVPEEAMPLERGNGNEPVVPTSASAGSQDDVTGPRPDDEGGRAPVETSSTAPPASGISRVPLALVVAACPAICDYARGGIRTIGDLCATADLVRSLLGVTLDAWAEASRVMGREGAAIVIAAILQRGDAIKSPGGYLRSLARRTASGRFSVWPMLLALDAARRKTSDTQSFQDPSIGGSRPIVSRCS